MAPLAPSTPKRAKLHGSVAVQTADQSALAALELAADQAVQANTEVEFAVEHDDYQVEADEDNMQEFADEQEDGSQLMPAAASSSNPTIGVQDASWIRPWNVKEEEWAANEWTAKEEHANEWTAKEEHATEWKTKDEEWDCKDWQAKDWHAKDWNAKQEEDNATEWKTKEEEWDCKDWHAKDWHARDWKVKQEWQGAWSSHSRHTQKPPWAFKDLPHGAVENHKKNECQSGRGIYVAGGFVANESSGGCAYQQLI